jgi:ADP-heptose:LPS heptosyltransferase
VARGEKEEENTLKDYLDADDDGKRILYVIPESAGDVYMSTSLFKNIKQNYPEHNLYVSVKSEYIEMLDGNPHVHKVIPFFKECENALLMEGHGDHDGFFDILFLSHLMAQRQLNYLHNGKDKIMFDMKTF